MAVYLRQMARRQRELAEEFDQKAEAIEQRAGLPEVPADRGHTFRIAVKERGSTKVVGEEHHRDGRRFEALPRTVDVRAWNLSEALAKAASLPLASWFEEG